MFMGSGKTAPEFFLQDYIYKLEKLKDALVHVDEQTEIYPIWLCPLRVGECFPEELQHLNTLAPKGVLVDVGIYG